MDHNAQQQQLEYRAQTECPSCHSAPMDECEVWVKEGSGLSARYRKVRCCNGCFQAAVQNQIKTDQLARSMGTGRVSDDYYMSGTTLRHIGTTGDREVHTFKQGESIK